MHKYIIITFGVTLCSSSGAMQRRRPAAVTTRAVVAKQTGVRWQQQDQRGHPSTRVGCCVENCEWLQLLLPPSETQQGPGKGRPLLSHPRPRAAPRPVPPSPQAAEKPGAGMQNASAPLPSRVFPGGLAGYGPLPGRDQSGKTHRSTALITGGTAGGSRLIWQFI